MPGSKSFARLIHRRVILVLHAVNFTASWVFSLELTRYLLLPTAHWKVETQFSASTPFLTIVSVDVERHNEKNVCKD